MSSSARTWHPWGTWAGLVEELEERQFCSAVGDEVGAMAPDGSVLSFDASRIGELGRLEIAARRRWGDGV